MKPTRCTLLLGVFISTSLSVSGNLVLFAFCKCRILRCLVCIVASCLVCIVASCLVCIVVKCLVCIVVKCLVCIVVLSCVYCC